MFITKLRVYLYCYENQNVPVLINYWSSVCHISQEQFTKPYIRKDFNLVQTRKMKFGMIHIRYNDKKLLLELKEMITQYGKKFALLPNNVKLPSVRF